MKIGENLYWIVPAFIAVGLIYGGIILPHQYREKHWTVFFNGSINNITGVVYEYSMCLVTLDTEDGWAIVTGKGDFYLDFSLMNLSQRDVVILRNRNGKVKWGVVRATLNHRRRRYRWMMLA